LADIPASDDDRDDLEVVPTAAVAWRRARCSPTSGDAAIGNHARTINRLKSGSRSVIDHIETLSKHYDERSQIEKMRQRRDYLTDI
jgi:hypothetical protein